MSLSFEEAKKHFMDTGFYPIEHAVVIHHMRKDFEQLEVSRDAFFIKPIGPDYLHVAVVEYEYGLGILDNFGGLKRAVNIAYGCAGDDLLYGLRVKYPGGGSTDNWDDVTEIEEWAVSGNLREHPKYTRPRFRHTRVKAKTRALFVMVKDIWRNFFS